MLRVVGCLLWIKKDHKQPFITIRPVRYKFDVDLFDNPPQTTGTPIVIFGSIRVMALSGRDQTLIAKIVLYPFYLLLYIFDD